MKSRTLVVVATLIAVSSCGDASEPTSNDAAEPSITKSATVPATADTLPSPTRTPDAPTYQVLDKVALTEALLALDAMPAGYSQNPDEEPASNNKYFCDYSPPFDEQLRVERDFQRGAGVGTEFMSVVIRQFESAEQARASFEALEAVISTCTTDTLDGEELTYAQVNVERVGEGTVGVRIEGPVFLLQGFALVGPSILSAGTGGLLNADAALQAETLSAQVDKYMQTVQR